MTFLSPIWIFWIWITVALYWLTPWRWRVELLIAISALFLASVSLVSFAVLAVFFVLCWLATARVTVGNAFIACAVAAVAGTLIAFKLRTQVEAPTQVEAVAMPLGLSFFSFRCIHFLLERYKGNITRASPREIAGYLFFIPTFVIGPIHRFDDYRRDERRQRFDWRMLYEGSERIVHGYAKIVVLSNALVEAGFGRWIDGLSGQETPAVLYLQIVRNGLTLYFQFSGHSDIAIGFARLLGFRVIENFNWPYLQPNISAFWRSWHISLSRWSRDYVYGGVVAHSRSPALGALATMTVIGLWHEISFRFLLWGFYHGLGLIVWQRWQAAKMRMAWGAPSPWVSRALHVLSVVATANFVWFGFVILSAEGPLDALRTYRMFLFGWLH